MSKTITIQGTIIQFPESGTSPDWAAAVDQFAEAVEAALSGLAGAYDVSPQVLNIDAHNPTATNIDITNLAFSTATVRSAEIKIAVYRHTTTTTVSEFHTILITYNADNGTGQKWEISDECIGGGLVSPSTRIEDPTVTFNVTDSGQLQFVTTTLGGSNHTGLLSFSGKALLNT